MTNNKNDADTDIIELPVKIVQFPEHIKKESNYKKLIIKVDEILEKISEKELKQKIS
jgi:hypothetical protein